MWRLHKSRVNGVFIIKTDIKHEGIWWSLVQTCDRCGQKHAWRQTNEPDTEEADFCVDCMRYLLDNKIPYETAKKRYGCKV